MRIVSLDSHICIFYIFLRNLNGVLFPDKAFHDNTVSPFVFINSLTLPSVSFASEAPTNNVL